MKRRQWREADAEIRTHNEALTEEMAKMGPQKAQRQRV